MSTCVEPTPSTIPTVWSEILHNERATAVREERRRFSNELHDVIASHLNSATLFLAAARQSLPVGDVRDLIDAADKGVRNCWSDARRCAAGLRALGLEEWGLTGLLSKFARQLSAAARIPVTFACSGVPTELSQDAKVLLLRVAQEAATNAIRHADPKAVSIEMTFATDGVGLMVADDGAGFDLALISPGLGLAGIQDRARMAGAELAIVSQPGHGTQVALTIPAAVARPCESESYLG